MSKVHPLISLNEGLIIISVRFASFSSASFNIVPVNTEAERSEPSNEVFEIEISLNEQDVSIEFLNRHLSILHSSKIE